MKALWKRLRSSRRGAARAAFVAAAAGLLGLGATAPSWASTPTIRWGIPDAPTPVSTLVLPMAVQSAPDASGLYFAYYTTLESGTRPYAGFQPKPADASGRHQLQAVFSSFNAAATTTDSHCSPGADGGPGVSCAVTFPYTPGTEYSLVLKRASVDGAVQTMTGDVVQSESGLAVAHIGSFRLPADSGRFRTSDGGFIEPYLTAGCSQRATVVYGRPTGEEGGRAYTGTVPTVSDPSSGSCIATSSADVGRGLRVTVGGSGG